MWGLVIGIFLVSWFASQLVRMLPGDPIEFLLSEGLVPATREQLSAHFSQSGLFHWGNSFFSNEPTADLVWKALAKSLILGAVGMSMTAGFCLSIGIFAAYDRRTRWVRWCDSFCTALGTLTAAIPSPWLGPLLMWTLGIRLGWFELSGDWKLPSLCLALVASGFWVRFVRDQVRESLKSGSASGARARGVPEWRVLFVHGFFPASPAILAYFGSQVGAVLSGLYVIEIIFDWPGLGQLLTLSVLRRDYPVIQGALVVSSALCLLGTAIGNWSARKILARKGGVLL